MNAVTPHEVLAYENCSDQEYAKLLSVLDTLKAASKHRLYNRIEFFDAYPKQRDFFDMGITFRERLLMAGNQLGKTECGAAEMVYHLTGLYPDDWLGRRWDRPIVAWAAGETSTLVRDVQQKKLCGEPGVDDAFGTGLIPKHLFVDKPSLARGVTDAYDTIQVRHVSGGISVLKFKSYEQGRAKFQGAPVDIVWFDEEPDMDVYSEGLTRVTATGGMVYLTFTPLKGMSSVVMRYLNEPSPDRGFVTMIIDDALHIPEADRAKIIAGYPAHEREARARGVPMLGSGRIFPYSDESISEPAIQDIPAHWAKLWGIDFGIDHPFAAALILWDKDSDVIHLHHCFEVSDQMPLQHSVQIKAIAAAVPVAWPQDGTAREKSGEVVATLYRKHGVPMLGTHATWEEGGYSTERGILELQERMTTGRFKVASHLSKFFDQYRLYHRKDGQIVKLNDDILSAVRVAIMAKRYAKPVPLGPRPLKRRNSAIAEGVDFDVFA